MEAGLCGPCIIEVSEVQINLGAAKQLHRHSPDVWPPYRFFASGFQEPALHLCRARGCSLPKRHQEANKEITLVPL